jgi:hypothetical protein
MSDENEIVGVLKPGIFDDLRARGEKLSKAAIAFEQSLPMELTRKQAEELRLRILMLADPEERREMLRDYDTCPCCNRWLGHNRPPADGNLLHGTTKSRPPRRRQTSFDFDR